MYIPGAAQPYHNVYTWCGTAVPHSIVIDGNIAKNAPYHFLSGYAAPDMSYFDYFHDWLVTLTNEIVTEMLLTSIIEHMISLKGSR